MPKKYNTHEERILSHIKEDDNGCWIWQLSRDNYGYGMSYHTNGKQDKAHRVSYTLFVDAIPKGKSVCHSCDVRACVNPSHLWVGTAADNARDAAEKNRLHGSKTKLTAEQKKQMIIAKANGATKLEIAEQFGVSQNVVQKYWKGENDAE